MPEHKITKSMIAFKHSAQSILHIDIDYAKIFLKNSFRPFLANCTNAQLFLVHQIMTKQILI